MEILFSLIDFLIILVGIAIPLALLCVCLPVIYFVASIAWSLIMDKLHPSPNRHRPGLPSYFLPAPSI